MDVRAEHDAGDRRVDAAHRLHTRRREPNLVPGALGATLVAAAAHHDVLHVVRRGDVADAEARSERLEALPLRVPAQDLARNLGCIRHRPSSLTVSGVSDMLIAR